jgi:hypothetical protein
VKRDLTLAIMKSTPSLTLLVISASCFLLPFANAVDWPQWRGINRDGISSEKISPASWGKDGRADWMTLGVTTGMLGLWLTERWHGYDIAVIAVVGALILTLPRFSVLIEMVGQALIWLTPSPRWHWLGSRAPASPTRSFTWFGRKRFVVRRRRAAASP